MDRVLLTGFEPFDGETRNPSELAVQQLDGRRILKHEVVGVTLPCVFGAALEELRARLREHRPRLVVCVGQAGGRSGLTVERVAINVDDARIPDNSGAQPIDEAIAARGPVGYWSTLPVKAIVEAWGRAGIAGSLSQTAGTFVCNHVFYGLMHHLRHRRGDARGGFVHVPYLPEQVRGKRGAERPPSMPLEEIVRGLEVLVRTSLRTKEDRRITGGALH